MKLFKFFAVAGFASAQSPCTLITATCDHTGFHVVLSDTCRSTDYSGITINEVYASGWTQNSTLPVYGAPSEAPAACRFSVDPSDSTQYLMDFTFLECGTDYPDSNSTDLIYRNTIQANEYYSDMLMGAKIRYMITCTGDRVAEVTSQTGDITAETELVATDNQNKPASWVDNIISMKFYNDAGYANEMSGSTNVVPFGHNVFTSIELDNTYADIDVRTTSCWATESADSTSSPSFTIFENSCPTLDWVNVDDSTNGASEISRFDFRSFRYPGSTTIHLHCEVYICHDDATDICTVTCPGSRRRRQADINENGFTTLTNGTVIQDNGLPAPRIITAAIDVTDIETPVEAQRVQNKVNRLSELLGTTRIELSKLGRVLKNLKNDVDTL